MVDGDDDDDDDAPKLPGVILFLLLWGTFYPYKWFSILCIFSFIKWQHHKHSAVHIPQSYVHVVNVDGGGGVPGIYIFDDHIANETTEKRNNKNKFYTITSIIAQRYSSAILVSSAAKRPGFYEYINNCSFVAFNAKCV